MAPWVRGQIQVLGNDHILDIGMERLKYITFQTYQVHFYVGKSKKKKQAKSMTKFGDNFIKKKFSGHNFID